MAAVKSQFGFGVALARGFGGKSCWDIPFSSNFQFCLPPILTLIGILDTWLELVIFFSDGIVHGFSYSSPIGLFMTSHILL